MKTIRGALAAALLLTSALSVQAAEYRHFSGPTWRTSVADFLKNTPCDPASVTAAITAQGDVHVYCVKGTYGGTYSLLLYSKHPINRENNTIKALVDAGQARIFGVIGDDVYVLTWTKQ